MRRPNYNWILQNWRLVASKLCEEVTTHDMLDMFIDHVQEARAELDRARINSTKYQQALLKLQEAKALLDPDC